MIYIESILKISPLWAPATARSTTKEELGRTLLRVAASVPNTSKLALMRLGLARLAWSCRQGEIYHIYLNKTKLNPNEQRKERKKLFENFHFDFRLVLLVPRLPGVLQEEGVVGERRHGDAHLTQVVEVLTAVTACMTAYLTQVVEILDDRGLPQEEAV